jgi:hypothetical protein
MALYSTFFLCKPRELPKGFPGWKLPLPKPVRRKVNDPFTGEKLTVETRDPLWPEYSGDDEIPMEFGVVAIEGRYKDYLEERLPEFVRGQPHWCTKGIMKVELDPLAVSLDLVYAVEDGLFSPPSSGAFIWRIRPEMLEALLALDDKEVKATAKRWAEAMSMPEHTHSASGDELSKGWKPADALQILKPLIKLGGEAGKGQAMYLLMEL